MTTLAEACQRRNSKRFISQATLTLNHAKIETLGTSQVFAHIVCLHLTGNKLQHLRGIEQFVFLRTLQVSHNMLGSVNELYRIVNPSLLQVLGCAHNPLAANPMHVTHLLQKFTNLTQLDDIKLNFPHRQYFNWIEQISQLLLPAYHRVQNCIESDGMYALCRDLNLILKRYDYQLQDLNQVFQRLLHRLASEQTPKESLQQTLLWDILHYQQQSKSMGLKNFLVQASLENHDVDLFLFAQNDEYARHAMTCTFLALSQNGFPYFPLDRPFLLALIHLFTVKIKPEEKRPAQLPRYLIVKETRARQMPVQQPQEFEPQPAEIPTDQKPLDPEQGVPVQKPPLQEPPLYEALIYEPPFQQASQQHSTPTAQRVPQFTLITGHLLGNLAWAWFRLMAKKRIRPQLAVRMCSSVSRLQSHRLSEAFQYLRRRAKQTRAIEQLCTFIRAATHVDKSNTFDSLWESTKPSQREDYLLSTVFHRWCHRRRGVRMALSNILGRRERVNTRALLSYLLRWKIITTHARYRSHVKARPAFRESASTLLPKRSYMTLDPETTRPQLVEPQGAQLVGPITISNATIVCDKLSLKKKKKKKKKRKTKQPELHCDCRKRCMYCDICRSFIAIK